MYHVAKEGALVTSLTGTRGVSVFKFIILFFWAWYVGAWRGVAWWNWVVGLALGGTVVVR